MKKLFALLLALAMIFAVSATVFADEEENNADPTRTIEMTMAGIKGHTYHVFQIYTGVIEKEITNAETGAYTLVLSDLKYGASYNLPVGVAANSKVPESEVKAFIEAQDNDYFLGKVTSNNPYDVINPDGALTEATIKVAPGYYMIVDVTPELDNNVAGDTKSITILKVAEEITIASKHATISSTKKVQDKNDSIDGDITGWQDSADYDIGDKVPFQLTVTLPDTLEFHDTYVLTFHDNQAAGFDYPTDFKVIVVDKDGNEKFEISKLDVAANTDPDTITDNGYAIVNCKSGKCEYEGCTFNVRVGDILELYKAKNKTFAKGDQIIVTYSAVLNNNAVVGKAGNENSMYVCHPDGHTPKDAVTVLTYELRLDKVIGGTEDKLAGAGFTLMKYYQKDGVWGWYAVGNEVVSDGIHPLAWTGLDDGHYKLLETTTPKGYNTMEPAEGWIVSEHKPEWLGTAPAFMDVNFRNATQTGNLFFDAKGDDGVRDGIIEGVVENFKGTVLPETGAEGTFFLIAGGSLLVMVAAVFMITRKKMSIYED